MQSLLRCQITKQLSRLIPLSLSNNKNYRLEKSRVFLCKIAVKLTINQNLAVSKILWEKC